MPLTQITGSIWNSTGNILVDSLAELPDMAEEGLIFVSGQITPNDGNGGWYKYEVSELRSNADGIVIVDPTGTGIGNGCWIRQHFVSVVYGVNLSETQTAIEGQTNFIIQNFIYRPDHGELSIYINGLRLTPNTYTETGPNTVTLLAPTRANDIVEFVIHEQPQPGQVKSTEALEINYDNAANFLKAENVQDALDELAAIGGTPGTSRVEGLWVNVVGQSIFQIEHNIDALDVFLNGIRLDALTEYSANGAIITLTTPIVNAADRLVVISYRPAEAYNPVYYENVRFVGPAGETKFYWTHDSGSLNVFLNGLRLHQSLQFSTDGNSITLFNPLDSDTDILEAFAFKTFNVADAVSKILYDTEQATQDSRLTTNEAKDIEQDGKLGPLESHAGSTPNSAHVNAGGNTGYVYTKLSNTPGDHSWQASIGLSKKGESIPGVGNIWTDVNGYNFIGTHSETGVIVITTNTALTIGHNGVIYDYIGPSEVEIGAGAGPGTYTKHITTEADFIGAGAATHSSLTGRDLSDCHPQGAVTNLVSDQGTQNTRLSTLETASGITDTEQATQDSRLDDLETYDIAVGSEQVTQNNHLTDLETWDTTHINAANPHAKMNWVTPYVPGAAHKKWDVVKDGDWTMNANKDTNDRAAPQPIGVPAYLFDGGNPVTQISAKELTVAQRYTFANDGYTNGYRVYTIVGNEYRVYTVKDPEGTPITEDVLTFTGSTTGWTELSTGNLPIAAGTIFDLAVHISEPDSTPTTFSGAWNYTTPNNTATPVTGQIVQSNSNTDLLRIHTVDNNSTDRRTELLLLEAGDIINGPSGARWAIQVITDHTTWFEFVIAPASQSTPDGVFTFVFETVTATPITTISSVDYWLLNGSVSGWYSIDGGAAVHDEYQRSIDLQVQDAYVSPDWNIVAVSGGGGGSTGGSGTIGVNPKLVGYEEEVLPENNGNFDYTAANFFTCVPAGDITITPNVSTLVVISATIHMDNTGGHTITMPTGTEWVGGAPILGTKYVMTLYTMNGGIDWFAVYIGDLV